MQQALAQARAALPREVPIGAVIVSASGEVLAAAHNLTETTSDPTAHAEILAIRQACAKRGSPRLPDCDLYVTLEPCPMCAAAIGFARLRRVYFGAFDPKGGGVEHGPRIFSQPTCHHRPEIIAGLAEAEAAALLTDFFQAKR
ncbi:MAG: nucleoside deaminase [Rickettsiales bacterium]|nr:nucleoside deaminase [Rickettsiales bacterium]